MPRFPIVVVITVLLGTTQAAAQDIPVDPSENAMTFSVTAAFPATVVYSLVAVSGRGRHGGGFRTALGISEGGEPDWFGPFRERFEDWTEQVDEGDGHFDPFSACGYDAATLEDVTQCWAARLSAEDLVIAEAALRGAAAVLEEGFSSRSAALQTYAVELSTLLGTPGAQSVVDLLTTLTGVDAATVPPFTIVLIDSPDSSHSTAHQEGRRLVVEVQPGEAATDRIGIVVHEFTHFWLEHADTQIAALQASLTGTGERGLIALGVWNEAFATFIGNGVTDGLLDPAFDREASWYNDPAIDLVAHALYEDYLADGVRPLGDGLGAQLLTAIDRYYPEPYWRLADRFRFVTIIADDRELMGAVRSGLQPTTIFARTGGPEDLSRPEAAPSWIPRLVLSTPEGLSAHPAWLAELGLTVEDVTAGLAESPAALYRTLDAQGIPLVLIVAQTPELLRTAVAALGWLQTLPDPGWSPLVAPGDGFPSPSRH